MSLATASFFFCLLDQRPVGMVKVRKICYDHSLTLGKREQPEPGSKRKDSEERTYHGSKNIQ